LTHLVSNQVHHAIAIAMATAALQLNRCMRQLRAPGSMDLSDACSVCFSLDPRSTTENGEAHLSGERPRSDDVSVQRGPTEMQGPAREVLPGPGSVPTRPESGISRRPPD
jgi:hypothetical protein